ncbi:uncharacterized protein [Apostichopus japonicus]|uniref:uncharacterized protein n=1 Tax=Stichopus japonicus TaxID=307972 RepID=UPI003AB65868
MVENMKTVAFLTLTRQFLVLTLLSVAIMPISSTVLPNLRRYRMSSTSGRFLVPRDALQTAINDRIDSDVECGNDVSLSLPESLPSADYDQSLYGEIFVAYGTLEELDLDYLPCDLKDRLETTSQILYVAIPYRSNGHSGLLVLTEMTDTKNRLSSPLLTNDKYRFIVDTIDEDGESVTLRVGEDSLTLEVSKKGSCQTEEGVGDDFDQVTGESLASTCYPERFDWGCGSVLGWDIGYCKAIKENLCEIQRYNGDVCMHATTSSSVRCPSTLKITSMNGVFREILPGLFDTLPSESFEAEWVDRYHGAGIKYPCLSQ